MASTVSQTNMISATDLRRAQEANQVIRQQEIARRNEESAIRFAGACDKYYEILLNEVKQVINHAQNTNKTSFILNDKKITVSVDGFSYSTLLFGFWNSQTRKFNDDIFTTNKIERPFDRAVAEVAKYGYKLENISDSSRSFRLFIKLSW